MQQENTVVTDMELVRRAHAGEVTAFVKLYRENAGRIFAICLRMLDDGARAKDATQETVIRAWQMLRSYRGDCPFSAWIRRIAVNAALDLLKADKRRLMRVESVSDLDLYDGERHATEPELVLDLESAIAALPTHARAVLVLHDIEGYSHEEIGGLMNIASGTSKAQLHRARALLKEALKR